jgi:hypothetical protein
VVIRPAGWASVFAIAALVVVWPSLGYDWHFDDLHLVRSFSATELAGTLTGSWDPDGIEEPGFRPLTTLFNHARATAFGEAVVLHRIGLIGLLAVYLTLLGRFAISPSRAAIEYSGQYAQGYTAPNASVAAAINVTARPTTGGLYVVRCQAGSAQQAGGPTVTAGT